MTENQRNTRTLSEYFSPTSKVKEFPLGCPGQQSSPPHSASFFQETPMKPLQVPFRFSLPRPRRMVPLQSPELCHRGRMYSLPYPPHTPGSSGIVSGSPANFISPARRPQPIHMTYKAFQATNLTSRKEISEYPPSSFIRSDQLAKPKVTSPSMEGEYAITQRRESNMVGYTDVGRSTPVVYPHGPCAPPSPTPRTDQEGRPLPLFESELWSPGNSQWQPWRCESSQSIQYTGAPRQDHALQQHKGMPSSEKCIPGGWNCSSLKRHRVSEDGANSAKKPGLAEKSSGSAQTPNCAAGQSPCPSLVSKPSSWPLSNMELSPKTTNGHLRTEPTSNYLPCVTLSSTLKPAQPSCSSLAPRHPLARQPSLGVKPAYMKGTQSPILRLKELRSPTKPVEESLKLETEEEKKRYNVSTLCSSIRLSTGQNGVPHKDFKDTDGPRKTPSGSHQTGHIQHNIPVLQGKSLSKDDTKGEPKVGEHKGSDSRIQKVVPKLNSGSVSCRAVERNRAARPRRPSVIPNDIGDLFTPDPLTYVVSSVRKSAKPSTEGGENGSAASHKGCLSSTVTASSTPSTGRETQNSTVALSSPVLDAKIPPPSQLPQPNIPIPSVRLERVQLENAFGAKDTAVKNSPVSTSFRQLNNDIHKMGETPKNPTPDKGDISGADDATSKDASTSRCSPSIPTGSREDKGEGKCVDEEDPLDMELGLGLSFELDLDLTQSSHSSEDEPLISLQEMMARIAKPPDTPEKAAFSAPSTPVLPSRQSRLSVSSKTKPGIYKNNLDQMLKEINSNKRSKEIETKLLTACKEDLLRIAEYEEAEENREEAISSEQQEFLQRYSLVSSAIRDVHPGEVVFNLENMGRLFNQHTLQLRQCNVNPQETGQKTLLWSSPAQLRLHVNVGLFQEAYDFPSPCPPQVTRFLFKMMSVHSERMISEQILQALCDIACTAAYQIVKNGSQKFEVWVPSVADVTLVLLNMGVPFVTLFPFENLQPPFTEGDLLEDIHISSESPSRNEELSTFPEHNYNKILKYLGYCTVLCPRAYSDDELLLLLTVVSQVGLETQLALQPNVDLRSLQCNIVNNIRDWDTTLPRICVALTDLTDDHHNMCWLVQLLPDNTRGKQLRRHLGVCMISKLLDGTCTYKPTGKEFQLSNLRPYLPRMQPSTLLRGILNSSSRKRSDKEDDLATLDQQTYYLCYSLLTLANEASNFQFFPPHQKEQLLLLCSDLERHIKCDIRESEKCLYRSKVKDLVARIYTKWQMLSQRTRPLNGKLYDYWQPGDTLNVSQTEEEKDDDEDDDDDEEDSVVEEQEAIMGDGEVEMEENGVTVNEETTEGEEQEEPGIALKDLTKNEEVTKDTLMEKDQEEEARQEEELGEKEDEVKE
ncbi:uncharacterized protein ACJ7VT_015959 [Polymixia lowei]